MLFASYTEHSFLKFCWVYNQHGFFQSRESFTEQGQPFLLNGLRKNMSIVFQVSIWSLRLIILCACWLIVIKFKLLELTRELELTRDLDEPTWTSIRKSSLLW